VGRTGRMGKRGLAVAIVAPKEMWILDKIAKQVGIQPVQKEIYAGELIDASAKPAAREKQMQAGRAAKPRPSAAAEAVHHAGKQAQQAERSEKPAAKTPRSGASQSRLAAREAERARKDKGAPKWLKAKREEEGRK